MKNIDLFKTIIKIAFICFICAAGGFSVNAQQPVRTAENSISNKQIEKLRAQIEAAKIATSRINEFRLLFASKSYEYDELKVLLPEPGGKETAVFLKGLRSEAASAGLIVQRFTPGNITSEGSVLALPIEVEAESNFNNLQGFFEKITELGRLVSISNFELYTLNDQTEDRTLRARFLLSTYYKGNDSSPENSGSSPFGEMINELENLKPVSDHVQDLLNQAKKLEPIIKEQRELETKIQAIDSRINTIKDLRSKQAGPSAVLEALRERITMMPGIFIDSVEQKGDLLEIKGISNEETAPTQFGKSLEFSGGLFSNLSIETQKISQPLSAKRNSPQRVSWQFTIRCAYSPSKASNY